MPNYDDLLAGVGESGNEGVGYDDLLAGVGDGATPEPQYNPEVTSAALRLRELESSPESTDNLTEQIRRSNIDLARKDFEKKAGLLTQAAQSALPESSYTDIFRANNNTFVDRRLLGATGSVESGLSWLDSATSLQDDEDQGRAIRLHKEAIVADPAIRTPEQRDFLSAVYGRADIKADDKDFDFGALDNFISRMEYTRQSRAGGILSALRDKQAGYQQAIDAERKGINTSDNFLKSVVDSAQSSAQDMVFDIATGRVVRAGAGEKLAAARGAGAAGDAASAAIRAKAMADATSAGALSSMAVQVYGQTRAEGIAEGLSPAEAEARARWFTATEYATELLPLDIILKGKVDEGVIKKALKASGAEGLSEIIATGLQSGYDHLNVEGKEITLGELLEQMAHAGATGALVGGSVSVLADATGTSVKQPGKAESAEDVMREIGDRYKASPATKPAGYSAIDAELSTAGTKIAAALDALPADVAEPVKYRTVREIMTEHGVTPAKAPRTMVERIVAAHRNKKPANVSGQAEGDVTDIGADLRKMAGLDETTVDAPVEKPKPVRFAVDDSVEPKRAGNDSAEIEYLQRAAADLDEIGNTDRKSFNADIHSLSDAVAFAGGLDRAHLGGEADIKTANASRTGKPVVRVAGSGLTPDHMAERLNELGFRTAGGENLDPNNLMEMLADEAIGKKYFSTSKAYTGKFDEDRGFANLFAGGDSAKLAGAIRKYLAGGDLGINQRRALKAIIEVAYENGELAGRDAGAPEARDDARPIADALVQSGFAADDADALAAAREAYEAGVPVQDIAEAIRAAGGDPASLDVSEEATANEQRLTAEDRAVASAGGQDAAIAQAASRLSRALGDVARTRKSRAMRAADAVVPKRNAGNFRQPYDNDVDSAIGAAGTAAWNNNINAEQAAAMFDALFPKAHIDATTGFYKAEQRFETAQRAIEYVNNSKARGFYVEIDLSNLGGLNAKLGHSEANTVYRRMAGIVSSMLSVRLSKGDPAFDQVNFRHGGDEMSFFVFGENIDQSSIEAVLRSAQERVWTYARSMGIHEIPHAKQKDNEQKIGVNFYFGVSQIEKTSTPEGLFKVADKKVEDAKEEPGYGYRKREAARTARTDAGGAGGPNGGDTRRGGADELPGESGPAGAGAPGEAGAAGGAGRDGDAEIRLEAGQAGRDPALDEAGNQVEERRRGDDRTTDLFGKTDQEVAQQSVADVIAEKEAKRKRDAERAAKMSDGPLYDGTAEQADALTGKKEEPAKPDETEASAILDAADVRGKDRLEAMEKFRAGTYTLDDLKGAYPPKAAVQPAPAAEKKAAKVTPQIASERQLNSMIAIAADSIGGLRSVDVDRVLSEAPAHFRLSLAQHIKSKRKDLAGAVDSAMEDIASESGASASAQEQKPPAEQAGNIEEIISDLSLAKENLDKADRERSWERDADKYWETAQKVGEERARLVDAISKIDDAGFGMEGKTSDGRALMLTPSASEPGRWQVTRMAKDGSPWGDTRYDSKQQAAKDMLAEVDPKSIVVFGERSVAARTEAPSSKSVPGVIDDFGEKLGGARKDKAAAQREAMERELSDEDIATLPLSKIWPKGEVDDIEDTYAAAVAHAARQEVPAKPRQSGKVRVWVQKVKIVRGLAQYILRGTVSKERFAEMLRAGGRSLEHFAVKVDLLQGIDRAQWDRIGAVEEYPEAYSYKDGKRVTSPIVAVEIDGRRKRYEGVKSIAEAMDSIREDLGDAAAEKLMKFEVRGSNDQWRINKVGDPLYRPLKSFTDSKEALAYVRNNNAELVAAWEALKERQNVKQSDVRRDTNRQRTAQNWRDGKDVTPQQFIDEFGFRGVEFGNWVGQGKSAKERQGMLNEAYDALKDLSDITGIPPKAISLSGSLGLGFGSRGHGWASAHFEPGTLVINLTKTRGAGALAHEWFHALDNHFQLKRGAPANNEAHNHFITYAPENYYVHKASGLKLPEKAFEVMIDGESHPRFGKMSARARDRSQWEFKPGVRTEVAERFAELVKALNDSPMAKRSRLIDKGKSDNYWSSIIEMAARSFENYVIHKMMLKGYHNDYLANVTAIDEFQRDTERYPYLLTGEIAPVAEAFDALFATTKTRTEADGRVSIYEPARGYNGDAVHAKRMEVESGKASNLQRRRVSAATEQGDLFTASAVPAGERRAAAAADIYHVTVEHEEVGRIDVGHEVIDTPEKAAWALRHLGRRAQEQMVALVTDKDGKPISLISHTSGVKNASQVDPGGFVGAIVAQPGARNVWLAHNHPGGDATPSNADRAVTNKVADILSGSGVAIRGHVVVGNNEAWHFDARGFGGNGDWYGAPIGSKKAPAGKEIPVVERFIKTRGDGGQLSGPDDAVRIANGLKGDGVMLLDNRLRVVGFVPMTSEDMVSLRASSDPSASTPLYRLLLAMDKTNAGSMIVVGGSKDAAENIAKFGNAIDATVHDWISNGVSRGVAGVAGPFFSLSKPSAAAAGGVGAGAVRSEIESLKKAVPGLDVEVVQSVNDLPAYIVDHIDRLESRREVDSAKIEGVFDPVAGRCYVVVDNLSSAKRGAEVALHENVAHYGTRVLLGDRHEAVMLEIERSFRGRADFEEIRNRYQLTGNLDRKARAKAADEFVARLAENGTLAAMAKSKPLGPVGRLFRAIREILQRIGLVDWNDADIERLLARAVDAVNRERAGEAGERGVQLSVASSWYFSPLARAVAMAKQDKMPAARWKATLQNGNGVKAEELEWSGVLDWLDGKTGSVTKAEVADFVRAGGVELQEVIKGEGDDFAALEEYRDFAESMQEKYGEEWRYEMTPQEEAKRETLYGRQQMPEAKYSKFQLHGGKNYRELLLTLPTDGSARIARRIELAAIDRERPLSADEQSEYDRLRGGYVSPTPLTDLPDGYHITLDRAQPEGRQYSIIPPGQPDGRPYGGVRAATEEQARADALAVLNSERDNAARDRHRDAQAASAYRSSHWQEPNVLAHIRFNERAGANGERVLHIEEVQSDWHQAGRKHGYAGKSRTIAQIEGDIEIRRRERFALIDKEKSLPDDADVAEFDRINARIKELVDQMTILSRERDAASRTGATVPDAPFKDTGAWSLLAMKRMIAYASANGFDAITWTGGEAQAERYDLRSEVDRINFRTYKAGLSGAANSKLVTISMKNGDEFNLPVSEDGVIAEGGSKFDGARLSDVVGTGIADKIMSSDDGTISEEGLKVGGKGMVAFYDKILPEKVGGFIKKFGGKVERIEAFTEEKPTMIGARDEDWPFIIYVGSQEWNRAGSLQVAKDEVAELRAKGKDARFERVRETEGMMPFQGFRLTPKLREAAQAGLPLFSQSSSVDAERQFNETARAYGGRPAYEKAKAEGRTKLNYRQWVQVRTPNFKKWFGDWEALRAQDRLDAMKPVQVRVPDEWRGLSVKDLRELVRESLEDLRASGEPLRHPEIGDVNVTRAGVKKAISEGADPAKLLLLGDLRDAFEGSFFVGAKPATDKASNIAAFEKLLVRLDVDGTELVAAFSVQRLTDGRQFYNAVALEDGQQKTPVASPGDTPISGERATPANTGVSDFVRRPLERVNPDDVSKVIDATTGEPLVVYHGTSADFSEFKRTRGGEFGPAIYLTDNIREASEYGAMQKGISFAAPPAHVMPLYAKIKNPYTKGVDAFWKEFGGGGVADSLAIERLLAAGYDGIIAERADRYYDNDAREFVDRGNVLTHYIVFDSAQTKSAIGNNGNFDPQNPDIRFSLSGASQQNTNTAKAGQEARSNKGEWDALYEDVKSTQAVPESVSLIDRVREAYAHLNKRNILAFRQGFIDSFASIGALETSANGTLLDAGESAYKAALMTKNLSGVMAATLHHKQVRFDGKWFAVDESSEGFASIFEPLSKEPGLLRMWEHWAGAVRAKRLLREGREQNYTQEQVDRVLAFVEARPELSALFNEAHRGWRAFNKRTLDMAEAAGVVDPAERKLWENDDYVPFHRVIEEQEDAVAGKPLNRRGLEGQSSGIRRLKGSDAKVNILESMVMNTMHLIDASMKNVAMQRVTDLADGIAMEKIDLGWKPVEFTDAQLAGALKKHGVDVEKLTKEQREAWSTLFTRVRPQGADVVSVMRDGKREWYRVTDPLLMRAITAMGPEPFKAWLEVLGMPKQWLTTMVTADPGFMLANFMRDTLSTWAVVKPTGLPSEYRKHVMVDAIRGGTRSMLNSKDQWALMAAGATGEGYYRTMPADVRDQLDELHGLNNTLSTPMKMWRLWQHIGRSFENANRLAVHENVKKAGGSDAEAAYQAMDVLNFSRRGDWEAVRILTAVVPFLNARIQGLDRLYRGAKENPVSFAMKGAALTAATMLLMAVNDDDDRYWSLPEWDRDTYWHFWIGREHFRIPKPFEVGALFATVPERAWAYAKGKDDGGDVQEAAKRMIVGTFAINPIPQAFLPAYDVARNESTFRQSPIMPAYMADFYAPEDQYDPYTSETMRLVADAMPDAAPDALRSPKSLEYLLKGYFGTLGAHALNAADMLTREASDMAPAPTMTPSQYPLVGRFWRKGDTQTKYPEEFYEMLGEAEQLHARIKKLGDEGRKDAAREAKDGGRFSESDRKALQTAQKEMAAWNKEIKEIYASESMHPDTKRQKIAVLQEKRNNKARAMVEKLGQ